MSSTPKPFRGRAPWEWALVIVVIVASAAVDSDLIPQVPWGDFLNKIVTGLFLWGFLVRPNGQQVKQLQQQGGA